MPLNEQLKEIPKWSTLIRCATQIGVVWTWFGINTVWLSGIRHSLITVWSCGHHIEGILDNAYKSATLGYMTDNLEAKLCFRCHYSAKIVDLFDSEVADLFCVCANVVNCWCMKI
jgi:hypothetical protein